VNFGVRAQESPRPVIILSANTAWFITNFCSGLVRGLNEAGYEPVVVAPPETLAGPMHELGVRHRAVRIDRSVANPLADLRLLWSYRRILTQERAAAYLGFTIKPNVYGSLAAASLGIPAIPNVSGIGNAFLRHDPLQKIVTYLSRVAFRRTRVVFFQNPDDRRYFIDRRIVRSDQTRVLPGMGVDLQRFAPVPAVTGPVKFLLIARLVRDKGIIEFIEAARSLREVLPEAQFQLLGPLDQGHRSAISKQEIDGWIRDGVIDYLGATSDVRPHIAKASAIVLPSYREGLPGSLLEGAAMARPLIACDVPGCREIVEDKVNGYLCAPGDAVALASAMRRLAELPERQRAAMGSAARGRVQERFSSEFVVDEYLGALAAAGFAGART
jgi:glycosyltransferase involved in cell wall biosynthesis